MSSMLRKSQWSHAQQEKLRAENRRREEFVEDNNRMLKTETMINANIVAEEKVENKILMRRLQREVQEQEMDQALEEVSFGIKITVWSNIRLKFYSPFLF